MRKDQLPFTDSPEMQNIISKHITEGIWMMDLNYLLQNINLTVVNHLGYSLEEMKGMSLLKLLTPHSLKIVEEIIQKDLTPDHLADPHFETSWSIELEFITKTGLTYWAEVNVTLMRDDKGKATGFLGVSRDISDLKKVKNALVESEKRYRTLFEDFPLGLYQTTPAGRIINVNPAFVRMLHYPDKKALLSLKTNDLLVNPQDRQKQIRSLNHSNILLKSELQIRCHDSVILWVRDNAHVVKDNKGKILYYEGCLEDITQLREAEVAQSISEARYRNLVENMGEGMTNVDSFETILFANEAADRMFGVPQGTLSGRNLREFLEPDQLSEVLAQTKRRKKGERSQYEIIITRPDQEKRILRVSAIAEYDETGNFTNSFCVIHDITDERKDQLALQAVKAELDNRVKELEDRNREMNSLTDMVNMLQRCKTVPETYEVIESYIKQLIPDAKGALYLGKRDDTKYHLVREWGKPALSKSDIVTEDCWALRREKHYALIESQSGPLCTHLGKPTPLSTICIPIIIRNQGSGLLHLQTDAGTARLTENHQRLANNFAEQINLALSNLRLQEELHEQAIRDSLTGLFNRYYMEETLEHEISRAIRSKKPIGLMMLDFDNFKELNTTFGHPKADEVLRTFGDLINSSVRTSDIACRYGGDEFLIIMPESSVETLFHRADTIRTKVKSTNFRFESHPPFSLTVSIGLALFPNNGISSNEILQAADTALMKAKLDHDSIVTAE